VAFTLHPTLAQDCVHLRDLALCRVLLMNNQVFPWLVLVPMRDHIRELFELAPQDYRDVMEEVRHVSRLFADYTAAHKMNVAALGNMVPQLHIHVIARFRHDPAWPQPVWNSGIDGTPYPPQAMAGLIKDIQGII
jgi:diadenosine tetraphosphate (Ap4A) HIT family hydrolase